MVLQTLRGLDCGHSLSVNGAPPLVLRGRVARHWCQWEEEWPVIGVSGRKSASLFVSGRNSAPSLVSVGGIVSHHWCQWEE
ncbi:unnamed protein product [Staurois parvus]|uniref:Uncharacterized protein n=1 Tax=Staurois parvus TaxID=386267 RepID=A0ABN9AJ39_9NEOB|nr:unnamed protein product [Staurois parvus]